MSARKDGKRTITVDWVSDVKFSGDFSDSTLTLESGKYIIVVKMAPWRYRTFMRAIWAWVREVRRRAANNVSFANKVVSEEPPA